MVFNWSEQYFRQIRELAMYKRLATILADCFISRIEEPVLPLMYRRYIDDFHVATSTNSEMDKC